MCDLTSVSLRLPSSPAISVESSDKRASVLQGNDLALAFRLTVDYLHTIDQTKGVAIGLYPEYRGLLWIRARSFILGFDLKAAVKNLATANAEDLPDYESWVQNVFANKFAA